MNIASSLMILTGASNNAEGTTYYIGLAIGGLIFFLIRSKRNKKK